MKKTFLLLLITMFIISCGNDTEIKNDVKKFIELECQYKQSLKKQDELRVKIGEFTQNKINSFYFEEREKNENEGLQELINEINKLKEEEKNISVLVLKNNEDFKKFEKELEEKYNSEYVKSKFSTELEKQKSENDCK